MMDRVGTVARCLALCLCLTQAAVAAKAHGFVEGLQFQRIDPAVVVAGRYKTAPYFVRSQEEMLEVLDELVLTERARATVARVALTPTQGYRDEIRRPPEVYHGPPRNGERIYKDYCATCHDRTTQGAPMPDDHIEWSIRARKGMQVLMLHVIEGYNQYLMPARGGCGNCSETELKAALDYILGLAGVKPHIARRDGPAAVHAGISLRRDTSIPASRQAAGSTGQGEWGAGR